MPPSALQSRLSSPQITVQATGSSTPQRTEKAMGDSRSGKGTGRCVFTRETHTRFYVQEHAPKSECEVRHEVTGPSDYCPRGMHKGRILETSQGRAPHGDSASLFQDTGLQSQVFSPQEQRCSTSGRGACLRPRFKLVIRKRRREDVHLLFLIPP